MKIWQWFLLLGIIHVAFIAGAIFGSEVIYIVEDTPTLHNGWGSIVQEVSNEDNAIVPHQSEQARDWLVCCSDYAFWRGTQDRGDAWQE
jgi:hypothetical protein